MKSEIEFYRTRDKDDAHAPVGHRTCTADIEDAIGVALRLSQPPDVPQRPDAMTVTDANGRTCHSETIDADAPA